MVASRAEPTPCDERRLSILYVGRDSDFVQLVEMALERESARLDVYTETSLIDGISTVESADIDCIVSEYQFREGNGLDLLTAVRSWASDLPFIMYTAHGDESVASRAISLGVTDYVRRDVGNEDFHLLANRILTAVEQYCVKNQLNDSDSHRSAVYQRVSDEVFALDTEWAVTYWSESLAERTGLSSTDVRARDVRELFSVTDSALYKSLNQAMETGQTLILETEVELFGGGIEARIYPDESGVSVLVQDAPDSPRTLGKLRNEHTRLQTLVQNLPVALFVVEADGTITLLEGKALKSLADALDLADGQSFDDVYGSSEVTELLSRALAGESVSFSTEVDGISFDTWVEPVFDDDGNVEQAIGVAIDVTERKQLEHALRDLQMVARELLEVQTQDDVATVAVDAVRDIVGWPLATLWLFDDATESLVPVVETDAARSLLGDAPTFPPDTGLIWNAFDSGEIQWYEHVADQRGVFNPNTPLETEIHVPLGEHGVLLTGDTEAGTFSDADLDLLQVLASTVSAALERADREQTLRNRETELAAANERLDEFVSLVAHDLRNPLSVAKGYLEIALETQDPDHFEKITSSLERMNMLIDDLLTLARHGDPLTDSESVDLRSTVTHAWSFVETNSASLTVESLESVEGDGTRLLQLFENLFRNAVEHGGQDVTVTVGPIDDGAGFYVEDDGAGISEKSRERVFEHGYTTNRAGTGFGLAIIERIADAHGWSVHLTEGTNGGARFEFRDVTWSETSSAEEDVSAD